MKQSAGTEKPAVREDKETVSEANGMNAMENAIEEIVGASETVGVESKDIDVLTDEIQNSDVDIIMDETGIRTSGRSRTPG